MTIAATTNVASSYDDSVDYRSLSIQAIGSVVFGLIGLVGFYLAPVLLLAIAGLVLGIMATNSIRKYSDELMGMPIAIAGLALNAIVLVCGPAFHGYVYLTEVPDGYVRANFQDLMSDKSRPTHEAIELDGKDIFIKGYVHLASCSSGRVKNFILVPDYATCCFGKEPPLTHMIEVKLQGDQTLAPSTRRMALTGKFTCSKELKPRSGIKGVYYQLRADTFR